MRIRSQHFVQGVESSQIESDLPLQFWISTDESAELHVGQQGLQLSIDRRIDVSEIEFVEASGSRRTLQDGSHVDGPALRLKDAIDVNSLVANCALSAIAYLLDCALKLGPRTSGSRLIPESSADAQMIEDWGTDRLQRRLTLHTRVRARTGLTRTAIEALLARSVGVQHYVDALSADSSSMTFRELWRVLESAFDRIDDRLVDLLSQYQPVVKRGNTREQIHALYVLRGRASHSNAKYQSVALESECFQSLDRLRRIAESVIETKENWGMPTTGTAEIVRDRDSHLNTFVGGVTRWVD